MATRTEGKGAVLSDCQRYRYLLWRRWALGSPVVWVMLNPSTADADVDDPTIRKCIAFSKRWGFGAMDVVNLYALRSTDPRALKTAADPIGPENRRYIVEVTESAGLVVCGWGANADPQVAAQALELVCRPNALRVTKNGQPRHPLYLPGHLKPQPYRGPLK